MVNNTYRYQWTPEATIYCKGVIGPIKSPYKNDFLF